MDLIVYCSTCRKTPIIARVGTHKLLLHLLHVRRLDTYKCSYCLGDLQGYGAEFQRADPESRLLNVVKRARDT